MSLKKISTLSDNVDRPHGKRSCGPPARYILATLAFIGIALQFALKVNLSVAIVAMVKPPQRSPHSPVSRLQRNGSDDGIVCPPRDGEDDAGNQDGEFDWSPTTQGHVIAAYYYGYVLTQLIGGRLADLIGGKMVFGPGLLLTGILTLLSPVCVRHSVGLFIACRVLQGAASGVVIPSMQGLMACWFPPEERSRFSGVIFSSVYIGSLVGTVLSGYLADAGGWPLVFYFFGSLTFVWFVPWMLLTYDTPAEHPRVSAAELELITAGLGRADHRRVSPPVPWLAIVTSPPVWAAIAMHFSTTWVLYTFLSELPTYTKNILHFNIRSSALISGMPYIFVWLTSFGAGFLSEWIQEKKYVTKLTAYRIFNGLAALGPGFSLLLLTFAECDVTFTVILFVTTLSFGGFFIGATYLNFMELGVNFSGTLSGIQHTFGTSPGFITPLVAAAIISGDETLGAWHVVFYVAMAIAVVPFAIYMMFGSVEEQPWNRVVETKDEKY